MNKHGLKTAAALLAGGVAALDAARRFSRRVPQSNSVVVFETIGRVPGKKRQKVFIGYPVHETEAVDTEASSKAQNKQIRRGVREADKWLRGSSKEDGERRKKNRTLGGNREAVCEFVMVKRSRSAKGKSIGVAQRCFRANPTDTVREEVTETVTMPMPDMNPDLAPPLAAYGRFYR